MLVEGRLTLYRHEEDFFVEKGDSLFYPLEIEKTVLATDRGMRMRTSNHYIGILTYLTSDCQDLKRSPQDVRLYEKSLSGFVEAYNRCKGGSVVVHKDGLPYLQAQLGLAGGGGLFGARISTRSAYASLDAKFENFLMPATGFLIGLSSPRVNERLSLETGMWYAAGSADTRQDIRWPLYTDRHYLSLELETFMFPLTLQYYFTERQFTPYIFGGLVHVYSRRAEQSWRVEREMLGTVETMEEDQATHQRNQLGVTAGAGLSRPVAPWLNVFLETRVFRTMHSFSTKKSEAIDNASLSGLQVSLGVKTRL